MRQSTVRRGLVLALLIGGLAQIGGATTVLVSANLESAESGWASRQRFFGSGRYQLVYAASDFAALELLRNSVGVISGRGLDSRSRTGDP